MSSGAVVPLRTPRRTLVMGATGGIGRAVVEDLGGRGATIVAAARDVSALNTLREHWLQMSINIERALQIDFDVPETIETALRDVEVDSVVLASGIGASGRRLWEHDRTEIEASLSANTAGPLLVLRAVLPRLVQHGGDVVCIGSTVAHYPTSSALYGATKAATHMMACNLRLELEHHDVRVIEIAPGRVKTDLFARARGDAANTVLADSEAFLDPGDVAACVAFALDMPRHAQINLIEVVPSRQILGGSRMAAS